MNRRRGINRNIVECKDLSESATSSFLLVLIETLWNVKIKNLLVKNTLQTVLIETLWNVKIKNLLVKNTLQTVLIETLWNVKWTSRNVNLLGRQCINRNIVECKAVPASPDRKTVFRINRNIVECKVDRKSGSDLWGRRINRNIVECKEQ